MIDLAKQIETLLLENDCVIVPELGGFIAYSQPSRYDGDKNIFLPPTRTIGFNPQLSMNDGLLVQSYMHIYQTDFPDALRIIQLEVSQLKDKLYQEGAFEFKSVGTLRYDMNRCYTFSPAQPEVPAPALYGLSEISLPKLKPINKVEESPKTAMLIPKEKNSTNWIGYVAAAAIAIMLFFSFSVPVENTYVDNGNYAALGTSALFEAIRSQSLIITDQKVQKEQKKETAIPANLKPVTTRVETVKPAAEDKKKEEAKVANDKKTTNEKPSDKKIAEKKVTEKPTEAKPAAPTANKNNSEKKHHIIVASLTTAEEAKRSVESFKKKGYPEVSYIEKDGRYRLCLSSYLEMAEAYREMKKLKDAGNFTDAWILTAE
ncbi:MAG: SPOR domain-containing protein [Phocaeicola sp.]